MPRSDEAEWWFNAVYSAVQEIPPGRVTTYGHIARLLGRPQCPRQVGVCLKHLPSQTGPDEPHFNNNNVPWQRVINAKGGISPRGPGGAQRQAQALQQEGVTVLPANGIGEMCVKLDEYGWFPDVLPSEEEDGEEEGSQQQ